jgi:NADPH:quinone reductase-like Zn-dependent oxidoreductase
VKAIVRDNYGSPDVLELKDIHKPEPKDDEVFVHDRVLGCDVAGHIEAVGNNVTMLQPGDEVFGSPFMHGLGAFAEWVCISEDLLAAKPANLSFEQAAAVPLAASTALQGLRDQGRIEPGKKVLIIGASGGVGTFAVQIAKSFGAEVSGVCSTRNLEMVRSLGADHVIDYTKDDFTHSGQKYDLIFQLAGTLAPAECRSALTSNGNLLISSGESEGRWIGPVDRVIKALVLSPFVSQKMVSFTVKPNREDLQLLKQFIEEGTLAPVIDRTYPLAQVPEAIRYLEEGHARGKIVISV